MNAEYSVEEVRNAARLLDGLSRRMLNDHAARIEADESAVPDGYTAMLSDGKRYWSDKPGAYGDWQPYFLSHPPAQAAQVDESAALAHFTDYFVRNYPGPDTIIYDPKWHAPKIFRAAQYAIANATTTTPTAEAAVRGEVESLPNLWRQREKSDEQVTEFDKGYEQASDECAEALEAALAAQPRAVPGAKAMADRLMGWRLPDDFRPDCGISFDPESLKHWPGIWPVGTNLFTADQAEQMFRYVLAAAPSPGESE